MKSLSAKRLGFSLIELLVVLLVVGLLSGGIIVAARKAVVSAKAVRITSDLNTLKLAYLMYSVDLGDHEALLSDLTLLEPYLDSRIDENQYVICTEDDSIYIGTGPFNKNILLQLEKQASETGLYNSSSSQPPVSPYDPEKGPWVWVKVQ